MKREDIIAQARTRMDEAYTADQDHRDRAEDDLRFAVGDQWPENERTAREAEGRPTLTINIMAQNVRQVTGQIRSLNPAIRVKASDGAASKDTAGIIEGLVRSIEKKCDAPSVYEAAAESAAACSMGFWRLRADYCDENTFDQEILIERIYNPFAVFFDPMAKHPTRKDARYAFLVEEMDADSFKAAYPDASPSNLTTDHRLASTIQWGGDKKVVVAEYFWIEEVEQEIALLPSGAIMRGPFPAGVQLLKKRKAKVPTVKWAKITGHDVLEGPKDFPSRYIPIVAVTGEEWHLGEETYRSSVIRFAKDPQILYNYARSTQAEVTSMQPKAPYLITTDQVAGLEDFWAASGKKNRPYLPYNSDPNAGAPQRVQPPMASQALMTEVQIAAEDIKRTTGIYDASLGARSNETSGKAILARKEESQNATSIYADNMVKAIAHTGNVLVDMIPRVYDTRRAVMILGEDDQEKLVTINDILIQEGAAAPVNDMRVGKYAVNVTVGPTYSSKREESRAGMEEFFRINPQAAMLLGDLYVASQDWEHADRAAERIRKTLPPGVAEDPESEEMTPQQMEAKQQQAMAAQAQQQQAQEAAAIAQAEAVAGVREAEAKARKAEAEAEKIELETAILRGDVRNLVEASVEQASAALTMRHAGAMS